MYTDYKNIEIFLQKYKSQKEVIFKEIDNYFNNKRFSVQYKFEGYLEKIISKESNQSKQLKNKLYLKLKTLGGYLYLTDENSSFKLKSRFIKNIKISYCEKKKIEQDILYLKNIIIIYLKIK